MICNTQKGNRHIDNYLKLFFKLNGVSFSSEISTIVEYTVSGIDFAPLPSKS
jgi:hypothetical protein